jgi:hypothetical protein
VKPILEAIAIQKIQAHPIWHILGMTNMIPKAVCAKFISFIGCSWKMQGLVFVATCQKHGQKQNKTRLFHIVSELILVILLQKSFQPRSSGYAIRWPRIGDLPSPQCSQSAFISVRFACKSNVFVDMQGFLIESQKRLAIASEQKKCARS